jgi:transposase
VTTTTSQADEITKLEVEVLRLSRELADKTTIIEELLRRLYRPKTEQIDPDQLRLFEMNAGAIPIVPALPAPAKVEAGSKGKKPGHGRAAFPERLLRETTATDLDEKDRQCSTCGEALRSIGTEACERGHIQPVKIIVKRWESQKYGCPNGHEVKTSEGAPKGLVERAKWTTESYVHIALSKYLDHQPLERIEKTLKRHGIELPTSTMNSMVDVVAEKCALIVDQEKKEILAQDHLEADATGIKVFYETGAKTTGERSTKELAGGHFWVWKSGRKVLFEFHPSGGGAAPLQFLAGWTGTLLADGSPSFDQAVRVNGIRRAGCWAHARRKFKEALDLEIAEAAPMIRLLQRLYWIEAAIKKRLRATRPSDPVGDALRQHIREKRSRRVVARIDTEIQRLNAAVRPIPKSPLGKSLTYIENQWNRLLVYLDDPKVSIDNNAVESAIRHIVVGRRNYLFAGSERGAKNAAALYSVINTCVALDVNPYEYFVDVLELIAPHADLATLTPWAWSERRAAALPLPLEI